MTRGVAGVAPVAFLLLVDMSDGNGGRAAEGAAPARGGRKEKKVKGHELEWRCLSFLEAREPCVSGAAPKRKSKRPRVVLWCWHVRMEAACAIGSSVVVLMWYVGTAEVNSAAWRSREIRMRTGAVFGHGHACASDRCRREERETRQQGRWDGYVVAACDHVRMVGAGVCVHCEPGSEGRPVLGACRVHSASAVQVDEFFGGLPTGAFITSANGSPGVAPICPVMC